MAFCTFRDTLLPKPYPVRAIGRLRFGVLLGAIENIQRFLLVQEETLVVQKKTLMVRPCGADGRRCRTCAPPVGREAVAVHLFRGMQSTHSIAWAGSADVTLSFLLAFKTLARACVMRGYRDASSIGNVR